MSIHSLKCFFSLQPPATGTAGTEHHTSDQTSTSSNHSSWHMVIGLIHSNFILYMKSRCIIIPRLEKHRDMCTHGQTDRQRPNYVCITIIMHDHNHCKQVWQTQEKLARISAMVYNAKTKHTCTRFTLTVVSDKFLIFDFHNYATECVRCFLLSWLLICEVWCSFEPLSLWLLETTRISSLAH